MINPAARSAGPSPCCDPTSSEPLATDAQLIERAVAGDGPAWQELYERIIGLAWREAYSNVGDRSVAEEVVAEAMLAVVRNLGTIDPNECRLYGWVRTIVRNKASDWARRRGRQIRAFHELRAVSPQADHRLPDEGLLVDERCQLIVKVLDSLREDHREALQMKYVENHSVNDIANRMGKSQKSIEAILYRARNEFRDRYQAAIREPQASTASPQFPTT